MVTIHKDHIFILIIFQFCVYLLAGFGIGSLPELLKRNLWGIFFINSSPYINNKILNGVTRQTLIKLLKKNNFIIKEKPFNLIEAKNAKEAFLTSSTLSILPVIKIDNFFISNGKPGVITNKLIELYDDYIKGKKNIKKILSKELKIA